MLRTLEVLCLVMLLSVANAEEWTRNASFQAASLGSPDRVFVQSSTIWVTSGHEDALLSKNGGHSWEKVSILTVKGGIVAIYFVNASRGWAVGNKGKFACILGTKDGGRTWKEEHLVNELRRGVFADVRFFDKKTGIAVGGGEATEGTKHLVSMTRDGGVTWSTVVIDSSFGLPLLCVRFRTRDEIFAAGGDRVLSTSNGGLAWRKYDPPKAHALNGIGFTGEKIFVTGGWGTLFESVDAGRTWQTASLPPGSEHLFLWALVFVGDRGWITTDRGAILRTSDRGRTWSIEKTGYDVMLRDIIATPEKVIVCGDDGVFLTQPLSER
jgi:photosystem II stability/assembly factor-like uncharacterized protein